MFPVVCVQWRQHADLLLKMNWALAACVIMSSQRRQWGRMPATKCIHSGRLVTRAGSHSNMQRHSSHTIRWAKWAPWAEHARKTKPWFGDVCELWRAEMYSVTPKRGTHDLTMAHHVLCRQCPLLCLDLSLFIHLTICLYLYISYCLYLILFNYISTRLSLWCPIWIQTVMKHWSLSFWLPDRLAMTLPLFC